MAKFIALVFLILTTTVIAGDLDDGIDLDTPIVDDLTLDKNVQFIVRNALAKGKSGKANGDSSGSCGSGNITIGAGSKIKEVINISSNTGTTAVCGK